jgi:hypothetical protein
VEPIGVDISIDVPIEIRARVEANAFFDALNAGDYAGAAQAQANLRSLGWYVSREPLQKRPRPRRQPSLKADGQEALR